MLSVLKVYGIFAVLMKGSLSAQLPVCDGDTYIGIRADTPDWWCNQNCNWNPRDCPDTHCACAGPSDDPTPGPTNNPTEPTPSPTDPPTKSPNVPTTDAPTDQPTTGAPTAPTAPTACPECPECYPTPPPSSRPEPFVEHCHCICYGDPHCKMWNCAKNNWQGPRGVNPPGMVYLMTRCNGQPLSSMPFDVISSIQRYDNDFSSIDYTILKLYDVDNDGSFYCIKIKGNEAVQYNDDCSDNYDVYPDQNEIVSLLQDKFKIKWWSSNGYTHLLLNIDGDGCADDLEIITQTVWSKEEAVEVKVSDCYKPSTCGICGNFYDTDLWFERLDGSHITLSEGCWGGTANDATGLSYLIEGTMGTQRRLQEDDEDDEPCFGLIDDIETECISALEEYSDCCEVRSEYCAEDIVFGCKWDSCSCVMGEATSLTLANSNNVVPQCVTQTLSKAMDFTCNLPSEDFIVPDMSIYGASANVQEPQCEVDTGSFIWIGIGIASAVWVVIGGIVYVAVIKPKFNAYQTVSLQSDTDQSGL